MTIFYAIFVCYGNFAALHQYLSWKTSYQECMYLVLSLRKEIPSTSPAIQKRKD